MTNSIWTERAISSNIHSSVACCSPVLKYAALSATRVTIKLRQKKSFFILSWITEMSECSETTVKKTRMCLKMVKLYKHDHFSYLWRRWWFVAFFFSVWNFRFPVPASFPPLYLCPAPAGLSSPLPLSLCLKSCSLSTFSHFKTYFLKACLVLTDILSHSSTKRTSDSRRIHFKEAERRSWMEKQKAEGQCSFILLI